MGRGNKREGKKREGERGRERLKKTRIYRLEGPERPMKLEIGKKRPEPERDNGLTSWLIV